MRENADAERTGRDSRAGSIYYGSRIKRALDDFKRLTQVIVANRIENALINVKEEKIYIRDIFKIG